MLRFRDFSVPWGAREGHKRIPRVRRNQNHKVSSESGFWEGVSWPFPVDQVLFLWKFGLVKNYKLFILYGPGVSQCFVEVKSRSGVFRATNVFSRCLSRLHQWGVPEEGRLARGTPFEKNDTKKRTKTMCSRCICALCGASKPNEFTPNLDIGGSTRPSSHSQFEIQRAES